MFRIPDWAEKAIAGGIMEYIAAFDFVLYADTPELARFASGFLIKEIVENILQKINATLHPNRSLWLYSGHDYTIANALNSFGLFKEVGYVLFSLCVCISFLSILILLKYRFICQHIHRAYILNSIKTTATTTMFNCFIENPKKNTRNR